MGHKNRESLAKQIEAKLTSMYHEGLSKHECKINHVDTRAIIFSFQTLKNYMKHANYFANYCKINHRCKTLEDCRPYIDEWLLSRCHLSAYTVKLEAAALAKIYGCSLNKFVDTPKRERKDIKRSRGPAKRDLHFSEEKHKEIVDFCKSTGLRRRELGRVTGDCLIWKNEVPYVEVRKGGKGGKRRIVPVIGNVKNVISLMEIAGTYRVFRNVPDVMDVHGYRAVYATTLYNLYARSKDECEKDPFCNPEHNNGKGKPKGGWDKTSIYYFRKDRKGEWLDKKAMMIVSKALGHNRISVVGEHYIRNTEE